MLYDNETSELSQIPHILSTFSGSGMANNIIYSKQLYMTTKFVNYFQRGVWQVSTSHIWGVVFTRITHIWCVVPKYITHLMCGFYNNISHIWCVVPKYLTRFLYVFSQYFTHLLCGSKNTSDNWCVFLTRFHTLLCGSISLLHIR